MSLLNFFKKNKTEDLTALEKLESRESIEQNRKKQSMRFIFLVGSIAFIVFIAAVMITAKAKYDKAVEERVQRQDAAQVELNIDNFALWQSKQEDKVEEIENDIKKLNTNMATSLKDGLNKVTSDLNASLTSVIEQTKILHQEQIDEIKNTKENLEQKINTSQNETISYVNREIKKIQENTLSSRGVGFEIQAGALSLPSPSSINNARNSTHSKKEEVAEVVKNVEEEITIESDSLLVKNDKLIAKKDDNASKTIQFHIPMGMAKGTTISGVNAPIFNFGKANESTANPVYISLDSGISIANNEHLRSEECFLLGAAAGSLSDQRGKIILQKISCIFKDTKENKTYKVEERINGWVYGEDGILGLSGRLITKEGKIIATALPLTLLQTALTYIEREAGATTNIISGENLGSLTGSLATGAEEGSSAVLEKLSDIYIKYLEELNPIVSLLPGRSVIVAFEGTNSPLTMHEFEGLDVGYFDKESSSKQEDYYNFDLIEGEKYYE